MTNPFQIQFTLRQHTPIIHFQHDQDGATLRASEVKPKLDKFIIEKLGGWDEVPPEWRVGKTRAKEGQGALDYGVRIRPIGNPIYYVISSNPPSHGNDPAKHSKARELNAEYVNQTQYFADNQYINSDDWSKTRRGVIYSGALVTMVFSNLGLKNQIEKHLQTFFFLHNFGTRQSKGFGCFSMDDFNESKHLPSGFCIYKKAVNGDWKNKAKVIAEDWKKLKAGNSHLEYYKSDLMKYFCKISGVRWEKRKIKREMNSNHGVLFAALRKNTGSSYNRITGCDGDTDNPLSVPSSQNYKYVRAVLGVAEQFEFGKQGEPVRVRVLNEVIKRFRAPVTFKVIDNEIYMICHSIPDELSDGGKRTFSFELKAKHNGVSYSGNLAHLTVPSSFSVCHFLDSPWLGNNFEFEEKWGDYSETGETQEISVVQNMNYKKIRSNV